jgi:hypothetical protein
LSDVAAHKDQLQQDACEPDERCVPCVDPTNGQNTRVCEEVGVYERACAGGSESAPRQCCHGAGECLNPEAIPGDSQGDMERDMCPSGKLCAPASLVNGQPVKCSAFGLSGVCLDICFAKMLGGAHMALGGDCQATEVCLPCVIGASNGMPGC